MQRTPVKAIFETDYAQAIHEVDEISFFIRILKTTKQNFPSLVVFLHVDYFLRENIGQLSDDIGNLDTVGETEYKFIIFHGLGLIVKDLFCLDGLLGALAGCRLGKCGERIVALRGFYLLFWSRKSWHFF